MATRGPAQPHAAFTTFGSYLRFLRRRARLTQRELAVAVNYSEGQICHLEHDRRAPDLATLAALFVPALGLEEAHDDTSRLLALAAAARLPPAEAPAAPTTGSPRRAAAPATPLIGRAALRSSLGATLVAPEVRLLTLIGPPGVGKTHLALQLAQDLAGHFPDGVHVVDLSPVDEAALVAPAIAQALGLAEEPHQEPAAALERALAPQRALLILDNVEQVADAAPLLANLIAAAPGLTLLLTSQVAMGLRAERLVTVPPLPVPDLGRLPPLDALAQVESVALLLARLRAVVPEFELTPANALPLAAICVRVDGLPLAIELVASRGRLLGPQELLSEVALQFQQLRRRGRDIPLRHQTLAAALTWSHGQLSPGARALFARLSVFVGWWRADAVAPVCDLEGVGRAAILDRLDELLEHSLLQRQPHGGETRLGMLAMVRAYAHEQLGAEADLIYERLLAACIDLAEQAEEQLGFGAEQALWMARMEAELDTVRAALAWAVKAGAHAGGLRLAGAMWRFWYMRGLLREGRRWLETMLALPDAGEAKARAHALDGAAILAWRQGDYAQAEQWLAVALALYRRERHQRGEARVLSHIGVVVAERGAFEQALSHYEACLPLYTALGDGPGRAAVLHNLGNLHCQQNNHERAMAYYVECLAIYQQHESHADIALLSLGIGAVARDQDQREVAREAFARSLAIAQTLGDEWTAATALLNLGDIASDRGEGELARQHYDEALAILHRLGDQQQGALVQARLGTVALLGGDPHTAVGLYRQCLMLSNALGFHPGVVVGLEGMAACAAGAQPLLATRLYGAAAALRDTLGLPVALAEQARHEQALQASRRGVEPAAWAVAWREGRSVGAAQAVALALTHVGAG